MIQKSACILNLENGDLMKESIERLLAEGIEVIAVDNNSQDNSKEVLKSFGDRIIYKIRRKLTGQSENRNWMIRQTHGKYILLLDSDILYHPKSFDYLIERLKNAPKEVKCIGFDPWNYTNVREQEHNDLPSLDEPFSTHGQPIAYTQYGVFDRDLFFKHHIWFDEEFGTGYGSEDNDYALQMLQKGFKCLCVPFHYYHNKHTDHWFDLHQVGTMRVKERQEYFRSKWGNNAYEKYYGFTPVADDTYKLTESQTLPQTNIVLPDGLSQIYGFIPRVMVGVGICPRTEYARKLFLDWYNNLTYPYKELFIDENSGEENARASRQRIRDKFLTTKNHFLLFCDADTIAPANALETLLSANKDIVTGLATARNDASVLAFWKAGYPTQEAKKQLIQDNKGLIEIDGSGLYLTLIKREVLEKINFAWKSIVDDAEFFFRARAGGYKVYLDPTILCKHYRNETEYNYPL